MSDQFRPYPTTAAATPPATAARDHAQPEFGSPEHQALMAASERPVNTRPPRRRRSLLGVGAVLAALTVGWVAWAGVRSLGAVERTETAAAAGVPSELVIFTDTASVDVVPGDVDRPTFRYRVPWPGTASLTQSVQDGVLTASLDGSWSDGIGWSYPSLEVTVPKASPLPALDVTVGSGSVEVTASAQATQLHTGTGSIKVIASGSELNAATGTGSIKVLGGASTSSMTLETSTGSVDVDVDVAPSTLSITTGTGSINALLPRGSYAVTSSTGTGSIQDELTNDPTSGHAVTATTSTGSIELRQN